MSRHLIKDNNEIQALIEKANENRYVVSLSITIIIWNKEITELLRMVLSKKLIMLKNNLILKMNLLPFDTSFIIFCLKRIEDLICQSTFFACMSLI